MKDYYVVFKNDSWAVKLENSRVISRHRSQNAAKKRAEELGRRNNRGVTVNAKAGYTRYRKGPEEL